MKNLKEYELCVKITWWIVNYLRSMYSSSHVAISLGVFIPCAVKRVKITNKPGIRFVHLHQTHENRRKGAQKAAKTRQEKSQYQTNGGKRSRKEKEKTNKRKQRKTSRNASDEDDVDENVLCVVCDLHDPLQNTTDEMVSWVQCDGCLSWCQIGCTELEENNVPDRWLCMRCSEVWC